VLDPIEDALPKLTLPAYVPTVLLEFVKAPAPATPAPFKIKAFVEVIVMPFRSNDAPLATVTMPLPSAVGLPIFIVPALIVVPPVYVLAPVNNHVPLSCFVSVPPANPTMLATLPPCAPPKVRVKPAPVIVPELESVMLPAPPVIKVFAPKLTKPAYVAAVPLELIKAPAPEIPVPLKDRVLVFVTVVPFRSKAAPLLTVTAPLASPSALVLPSCNVPALTVVPPE
jgi:hypothetical protein